MGYDKRTPTPVRGKSQPIRQPTGPVRRPGERFGPAGTSDEIGHGGDHIFGPGNGAMQEMMFARAESATRGSDPGGRGTTSSPSGGKDGFGPNGTSDEIGQGPDLPGFLGGIDTQFA